MADSSETYIPWRQRLSEPYREGVIGLESSIVVLLDALEQERHERAGLVERYADAISEIMAICGEEKGLSVSGAVLDQIEGVIAALNPEQQDTTEGK